MSNAISAWVNSATGPKTVHFWGPAANWGLVLAAMMDMNKPADKISRNMTGVLCVYSALFMRFAWMVSPRNYLLFACHFSNECAQLYQLNRRMQYEWSLPAGADAGADAAAPAAAAAPAEAAAAAQPVQQLK